MPLTLVEAKSLVGQMYRQRPWMVFTSRHYDHIHVVIVGNNQIVVIRKITVPNLNACCVKLYVTILESVRQS